jgi:hypothetical protein
MQSSKQGPMSWMDQGSCRGGFETRPYKSPDLCVRRAAALSPSAQALFDHLAAQRAVELRIGGWLQGGRGAGMARWWSVVGAGMI